MNAFRNSYYCRVTERTLRKLSGVNHLASNVASDCAPVLKESCWVLGALSQSAIAVRTAVGRAAPGEPEAAATVGKAPTTLLASSSISQ